MVAFAGFVDVVVVVVVVAAAAAAADDDDDHYYDNYYDYDDGFLLHPVEQHFLRPEHQSL